MCIRDRDTIGTVVNTIKTAISTAWNSIKEMISTVMGVIQTNVSSIWNSIDVYKRQIKCIWLTCDGFLIVYFFMII